MITEINLHPGLSQMLLREKQNIIKQIRKVHLTSIIVRFIAFIVLMSYVKGIN